MVTTIAAASEEQSVTTQNIAQSITETTSRIDEMTTSVEQGAAAVQEVNTSIMDVTNLSRSVTSSISEIKEGINASSNEAILNYALALEVSSHNDEMDRLLDNVSIMQSDLTRTENIKPTLCRYTDSFSVSVQQYDNDHIKIFEYVNKIHNLVKDGAVSDRILSVMKELAQFTTDHFAREEVNFNKTSYPDTTKHIEIHTKLLKTVGEIITKLEANERVDLIEVLMFLKKWLVDHIHCVDKKYSGWLNEHGIQ